MRVKNLKNLLYPGLATLLLATAAPDAALASNSEQSANLKLGIGESFGRWPGGVVHWTYNPTSAPAVFSSDAYFVDLMQDAIDEIEGVSGLSFVYDGIDSGLALDNYTDDTVGVGWEFLGGAAGIAGPRSSCSGQDIIDKGYCKYVDGRVRFNTATAWDTGVADFTERDFRQVAVHELLHLLGIGHSEKHISIMYADPYSNLHHLREDDIDGLQSLYGKPDPDDFTQASIYMPPAAGASPLTDSFISSSDDFGSTIATIDGTEDASDFAGVSWKAAGPYSDDVTIVVADPHGYYYGGQVDDRDCGGGICTFWKSIARMEVMWTFPGTWTAYLIVGGDLVATETVAVTTSPTFNEGPESTLTYDTIHGPAPLTVSMTLTVTGDDEGDAVNASWHIPTVGEIELDSGDFPASAGSDKQTVTFDEPGVYEIFTVVNDDWDRYGAPETGNAAGAGFRTLYRTVVQVTKVSDDVTSLSDANSDGTPDLATHVGGPNGKPQINIFSGADGSVHSNIRFLTNKWRGIGLSTVLDANQDGTTGDTAVAMLADHEVSDKIVVEVRRVSNGSLVNKITFRNASWRAIDVVVIDDTNGDGSTTDTSVAVLTQHRTNGNISVEIRKLSDDSLVNRIKYLTPKWRAIAAAVVDRVGQAPMGGLAPLVGVLADNSSSGKRAIEARVATTDAFHSKTKLVNEDWTVNDVTVNHDEDGDTFESDPAWQVVAVRESDRLVRVATHMVDTGALENNKSVLNDNWNGLRIDSSLDMNSNGSREQLISLRKRTDDQRRIHIKDYGTAAQIRNITP